MADVEPTNLDIIRDEIEKISAVEVADLFLSAAVSHELLREATREPGPSIWIVNRSDVCDGTLEALLKHPIQKIAERAAEKLKHRKATISLLAPPIMDEPLESIPDYAIEDVLGHPLCPFEAMLYYSRNFNEDYRASACLSLTRRLWEHPHQSQDFFLFHDQFTETFGPLATQDPSLVVRSYAARMPFWTENLVEEFIKNETSPRVLAKWAQNASFSESALKLLAKKDLDDAFLWHVIALDQRLSSATRGERLKTSKNQLERAIHRYYLARS